MDVGLFIVVALKYVCLGAQLGVRSVEKIMNLAVRVINDFLNIN